MLKPELVKKQKGKKDEIEKIIMEMLGKEEIIINMEIVDEVKKRLGINISKKYISVLRNQLGLGWHQQQITKIIKGLSRNLNK